ncbi:MAG TPA: plasmid pRiA4b ORF-3 family protein, partial [Phycisphaerae bacterium]|nr:plasmid pRiA4b ORF-3 family protein [Phycisphaerae bacterium]
FLSRMSGTRMFVPRTDPMGGELDMDGEDEDAVTLQQICPRPKSKLIYEYDFGDGWQHVIEVQKIVAPQDNTDLPLCLRGENACPPEDCGGLWGYYEMLEAVKDPGHKMHEHYAEWLGGDFDPAAFDLEGVNAELARWRKPDGPRR